MHQQGSKKVGLSCETALLKVTSDTQYIHLTFNDGDGMLMAMLDLSAAYDLVDLDIFLSCMKPQLGFSGHTQMVVILSAQSDEVPLTGNCLLEH